MIDDMQIRNLTPNTINRRQSSGHIVVTARMENFELPGVRNFSGLGRIAAIGLVKLVAVYDDLIRRFGNATEAGISERVAYAKSQLRGLRNS
jgi:hypothetical protein